MRGIRLLPLSDVCVTYSYSSRLSGFVVSTENDLKSNSRFLLSQLALDLSKIMAPSKYILYNLQSRNLRFLETTRPLLVRIDFPALMLWSPHLVYLPPACHQTTIQRPRSPHPLHLHLLQEELPAEVELLRHIYPN